MIGAQIITEQLQLNPFSDALTSEAVNLAISKFCETRSVELASINTIRNLRNIRRVDFTVPYLSNIIFKENKNNTRTRISLWRREISIVEIDKVENPDTNQTRMVKLLGLSDIRIAKLMYPELDVDTFLDNKYKICPKCGSAVIREWGDSNSSPKCHSCHYDLLSGDVKEKIEIWQRKIIASESRKIERNKMIEAQQMEIDFNKLQEAEDEEQEGADNDD